MKKKLYFITMVSIITIMPALSGTTTPDANNPSGVFVNFDAIILSEEHSENVDHQAQNYACNNLANHPVKKSKGTYYAHPTPTDDLLSSIPIWTQMSLDDWDQYQTKIDN